MNMTILTQDDIFVNYSHIASIRFLSGILKADDKSSQIEVYQVAADMAVPIPDEDGNMQQQIELGMYLTLEECLSVADKLTEWLSTSDSRPYLFKMPPMEMSEMPSAPEKPVNSKLEYRPDEA